MKLELMDSQITVNGVVSYCKCKCRHCAICSGDNKLKSVPYDKLERLALKFRDYPAETNIETGFCVYNCSDYPELPDAMKVGTQLSPYGGYQNLNGTPIRTGKELSEWVAYLKNDCGVKQANLTWFGTEEFHDSFAQKKGYFQYLTELAKELRNQNISYNNTVFILRSNLGQLAELYHFLKSLNKSQHFCLPDYRGNAKNLLDEYLRPEDIQRLPSFLFIDSVYTMNRNKFNSEWVKDVFSEEAPRLTKRVLFLVAEPENIDTYLQMSCDEIRDVFHNIDEKLQQSIPSIEFLAANYGSNSEEVLMDYRSALWKWIDMYFSDNDRLDKSLLFSDIHTSVMWK